MSKEMAKTTGGHHIADHPEYRQFIEDLKTRVDTARISAARAVNRDLEAKRLLQTRGGGYMKSAKLKVEESIPGGA